MSDERGSNRLVSMWEYVEADNTWHGSGDTCRTCGRVYKRTGIKGDNKWCYDPIGCAFKKEIKDG